MPQVSAGAAPWQLPKKGVVKVMLAPDSSGITIQYAHPALPGSLG